MPAESVHFSANYTGKWTETVAISHNVPSDPNHFRLARDSRATLYNFLDDLSNSGLAVRLYSEGGEAGPAEISRDQGAHRRFLGARGR